MLNSRIGEGEELKAPRHASAAATRDDTWRPLISFPTIGVTNFAASYVTLKYI